MIERFSANHNSTHLCSSFKMRVREVAATFYKDHKLYLNNYPKKYSISEWFDSETLVALPQKSIDVNEHSIFAEEHEKDLLTLIDNVHDMIFEWNEEQVYTATYPDKSYNEYRQAFLTKKRKYNNKKSSVEISSVDIDTNHVTNNAQIIGGLKRKEREENHLIKNYLTLWDASLYVADVTSFFYTQPIICDRIMTSVIRDPKIHFADAALIIKQRIVQDCGKKIKTQQHDNNVQIKEDIDQKINIKKDNEIIVLE